MNTSPNDGKVHFSYEIDHKDYLSNSAFKAACDVRLRVLRGVYALAKDTGR